MGVSRHHILSRKQGSSTAEVWVADSKARPHGWYVNLYFTVPGALLVAQPFLSVELVPCSIIQSVVCLQRGRTEASGDRLGLGPTEAGTRGSRLPSLGEWRKWQKAAASAGKPPALWGHTAFLAHMCSSILAKEELESWPPSWALRSASCSRSPRPSKTK